MEKDLNVILTLIENFEQEKKTFSKVRKADNFDEYFYETINNLLKNEVIETTYKFIAYTHTRGGDVANLVKNNITPLFNSIHEKIIQKCPNLKEGLFFYLDEFRVKLNDRGINLNKWQAKENDYVVQNEPDNFIANTIDEYLIEFNENGFISNDNYASFKNVLQKYFEDDIVLKLPKPLFFKGSKKKKLGYSLGQLHKGLKKGNHTFEFLCLLKSSINIFEDEVFYEKDFTKSNLYKYITSKPQ